jgi:hypothetical protein
MPQKNRTEIIPSAQSSRTIMDQDFVDSRDTETQVYPVSSHSRLQLRDHPLLKHRGNCSWPPVWIPAFSRDENARVQGEIGVLEVVLSKPGSKRCFLVIEHEGAPYYGCLFCSDPTFCARLVSVLDGKRGMTIKEIGDLNYLAPVIAQ